jgi:hypothetical protein
MADAGVAKPAYEYPHLRQNPGLPNVAAKKREVSAIWHEEVVSGVSWHGWAQIVRAARLARRGDIVVLALHCHESGRPDRREIHWPTVGGQLAPPDGALL